MRTCIMVNPLCFHFAASRPGTFVSLLLYVATSAFVQGQVPAQAVSLPDDPSLLSHQSTSGIVDATTGNIRGSAFDARGDIVRGAEVVLITEDQTERRVTPDFTGSFIFSGLRGGRYKLTITAPGFETFVSAEILLQPGELRQLPKVVLSVATANVNVQVTVSQMEIAQEQIHLQEKQRFLGVIPNFYSSYIWDAAPLTPRQKFELASHSVFDPVVFAATGAVAGLEQHQNTFPAFGGGIQGYGSRYAADYGDEFSNRMFSSAVLPTLFHQDPRYFYKGSGSNGSRAFYAVTRAFITRGDNGHKELNYSRILGALVSGTLSNAYHLGDDRGARLTVRNASIAIGGHAADNLLREFLLKRFTSNIPDIHRVKPRAQGN